jgi:hypothetical protein
MAGCAGDKPNISRHGAYTNMVCSVYSYITTLYVHIFQSRTSNSVRCARGKQNWKADVGRNCDPYLTHFSWGTQTSQYEIRGFQHDILVSQQWERLADLCLKQTHRFRHWRMASYGMLRRVALIITDVSEECRVSFIRVTRIGELGTTLAVTSNRRSVRRRASVASYS